MNGTWKQTYLIKPIPPKLSYNLYLLYGKNEGFQNEVISEKFLKNFNGELNRYDENEFINNNETLISEFYTKSLFDDEKIIVISRSTDKIVKFKISISAILLNGSLIIKMRAEIMNIKIKK